MIHLLTLLTEITRAMPALHASTVRTGAGGASRC